jgi:hypothetical protein
MDTLGIVHQARVSSYEIELILIELMVSFKYISIEQVKPGVYVITLRKPPENRLSAVSCQELIRAYHGIVSRCAWMMERRANDESKMSLEPTLKEP